MRGGTPSGPCWRRAFAAAALAIAVTRALLIVAGLVEQRWRPLDPPLNPPEADLTHLPTKTIGAMWTRWDAQWYLAIAMRGYTAPLPAGEFDMRPNFFPAFPLAIRAFTYLTRDVVASALIVANAAFLIALAILHVWTSARVSPQAANRLMWIYAAFPTSFYFSAAYAEALLLASLVMGWYALEDRRWTASGVSLAVAVLSRPIGILGAPVGACKAALQARRAGHSIARAMAAVLAPPAIAAGAYLLLAHSVWGDALVTVRTQELTRDPLGGPWRPFLEAWVAGLHWNDYRYPIVDGVMAIGAVASLPFVFRRVGVAEGMLASALVLFPLASGFVSFSRLVLPAFPLFVWLAALAARRPRVAFLFAIALSFALQVFLFAWYVGGGWVA
jgi:hypothetical protein